MTAPAPRFPTPADVAAGRIPARPVPPRFDRHAWEEALLAAALPHPTVRLLGWSLAHLAPSSGEFRAGTSRDAGHMAQATRLSAKQIHQGLKGLEQAGLIVRAPRTGNGPEHVLARAFTLTLPSAAARTEPAHTGGADR